MADNKKPGKSQNDRENLNESYNKIPDFKFIPDPPEPKENDQKSREK